MRPQLTELCEAKWFSFEEAEKTITFHTDLALLGTAREYIKVWYD